MRKMITWINTALGAKLAAGLGVLALIAAFLMPAVVAWDDARARAKYEQSQMEPIEILGFKVGAGEFVPPSERGEMGGCVILVMVLICMTGLAALAAGTEAVIWGPNRLLGAAGAFAGPAAMVIAALLTPWGLMALAVTGAIMLLAMLGWGAVSVGGGGC